MEETDGRCEKKVEKMNKQIKIIDKKSTYTIK
jgi:hypothetical protein